MELMAYSFSTAPSGRQASDWRLLRCNIGLPLKLNVLISLRVERRNGQARFNERTTFDRTKAQYLFRGTTHYLYLSASALLALICSASQVTLFL
jgi:hypothetical protein